MKNFTILAFCIAIFALNSCGTASYVSIEEDLNNEWVGKSHSDIVRAFGAPNRETSDGNVGIILVYEDRQTVYKTKEDTHFGHFDPDYTTTVSENCSYKHFFIGNDGLCYLVKSNITERRGKGILLPEAFVYGIWGLGILLPIAGLIRYMS